MRWSWRIGRLGGVDIFIHATFFLLLAWVALEHWAAARSGAAVFEGVAFILAIFGCVLLHELGHATAARRYGIPTRDITLYPIGGVARLERMPDDPLEELWVAAAGPLVNVAIAAGLYVVLVVLNQWTPLEQMGVARGAFLARLLVVNVFLVLFNLIPAFPMDGGRMLRAVLAMRVEYVRATQVAASIGQGIALLFGLAGLLVFNNPMLIFIALFVWIGAAQEASMTQMKAALGGIPARRAMITEYRALAPGDSLSRALEYILAGSQTDFPVVGPTGLEGILTRSDLLAAVARSGPQTPVVDVMQREFETVEPTEMLEVAFGRLEQCACRTLPVVHDGQLLGLITSENVGEFLMIQSALETGVVGRPPRLRGLDAS
ncbi:MAG: site-2 protease family protein [Planctomycetota bacterium]|nr:MAG: site-2 protease family protein [Planctomycetota bacterium]